MVSGVAALWGDIANCRFEFLFAKGIIGNMAEKLSVKQEDSNMMSKTPAASPRAASSQRGPSPARTAPTNAEASQGAAARVSRARVAPFPDEATITILSENNPKRAGTKAYSKWDLYKNCRTVGDVVAAFAKAKHPKRMAYSALRWDSQHKFIEIDTRST